MPVPPAPSSAPRVPAPSPSATASAKRADPLFSCHFSAVSQPSPEENRDRRVWGFPCSPLKVKLLTGDLRTAQIALRYVWCGVKRENERTAVILGAPF